MRLDPVKDLGWVEMRIEHRRAAAKEGAVKADAEGEKGPRKGESKTVSGPKITGIKSGLDAAVDQAFTKIDMAQLEKDWIEFSKKG